MDKNKGELETLFPPNPKFKRERMEDASENVKTKKVVTGRVRKQKRGLSKRLLETFLEDDTKSVGNYVFNDVLIPAAKSMICDIVGWGGFAEILLFGDRRSGPVGGRGRVRSSGGRTHYNYNASYERGGRDRREISRAGRTRHDFDEIVLETRGEAEDVLSNLVDLIVDYGQATVADLYGLTGIRSNFTDDKYGWTDLRGVIPTRVRDGYLLNLPRTKLLD